MRRRRSPARRALRRVRTRLERLNRNRRTTVDLAGPRRHVLKQLTTDITELGLTPESASALDAIVDGHAAEWRQSVERRRHSGLAELDHLAAEVTALVAQLDERCAEERGLLRELQSVAANVWDQVGEPEQPKFDPLR